MPGEPSLFLVYKDFSTAERNSGFVVWDSGARGR